MAGGREHFGWGMDRYMAADTYDAINLNTTATGNWKKGKQPDIPPWPRPKDKAEKKERKKKSTSVRDLYTKFARKV